LPPPPSRRQPFRSESWDQCEKSVEKSIKFSRWLRVEFTAASSRLTVLARCANTLQQWRERPHRWPQAWQAKRSFRVVAHATGLLWRPLRQQRHRVGGTERRPRTRGCNSHDDRKLPDALTARAADSLT
jgi:hypothetical protein